MARGGAVLQAFTDFMQHNSSSILSGPEDLINEACKQSYLLDKFLNGQDLGETVIGGKDITDFVMSETKSTFQFYNPNQQFTWQNPQVTQRWSVPWRYAIDHLSWTEHEVLLEGGEHTSKAHRRLVFKRTKHAKEMRLSTSIVEGMDNALLARAVASKHESAGAMEPYPLHAYVNEETNGLPSGFTTIAGLNPATNTWWRPAQAQYDYTDPDDSSGAGTGLFEGLERLSLELTYRPPPYMTEHFKQYVSKWCLITSREGKLLYQRLLRSMQDHFRGSNSPQDPSYNSPMWSGLPVWEASGLDDALLYDDGAGGWTSELLADDGGPRFYMLNTNLFRMYFHKERYFHKREVSEHHNQPGTYVMPINVWYQLVCRSRRRGCGIVSPGK